MRSFVARSTSVHDDREMRISILACLALVASFFSNSAQARADEPPPAGPLPSPQAPAPESPGVAPSISPEASRPAFHARVIDAPSTTRQFPAVGGHLGLAMPIVTISTKTTAVGSDFVTVGLTPGVTVHLDEKWAIDFEFIAFNELKNTPAATTFVVDPGIIRKFDGFVAGLRVATQVGAPTNSGVVPIAVVPFKIGERAVWFLEADVPLFVRDNGKKAVFSATGLSQTGVGF